METILEKRATLMALQYKHSEFSKKLATALSNGTCAECMLDKNAAMSMAINAVKRYDIGKDIGTAVKITITRVLPGESLVSILEDGDIVSSTSSEEDGSYFASFFAENLSGLISTVFSEENCLYLYDYANDPRIGSISALVSPITDPETITVTVEDVSETINADFFTNNCLSEEQLCNIIKYVKSF